VSGLRLQERDVELLAWVFSHGLAERDHLQQKFFGTTSRCNERLLQLVRGGYLVRCERRLQRSEQSLYRVTGSALKLLPAVFGADLKHLQRVHAARTHQQVDHALGLVDLNLAFHRTAAVTPCVEVDLWLPEFQCRHAYRSQFNGVLKSRVFKPDAFLRLSVEGHGYISAFLEYDRGHVSLPKWRETMLNHAAYRASGLFERVYGTKDGFITLVVTTGGPRRVQHMQQAARRVASERALFTTEAQALRDKPFGPIWQTADGSPVQLVPSQGEE
jgi:hypothetical protein